MALLCLLTLSLIAQAKLQESGLRESERLAFLNTAGTFFIDRLAPIRVRDIKFSEYDRCPHENRRPYGIGKFRLQVSCPGGDLSRESGGHSIETQQSYGGEMCKKWRYPGTQLPQLQLPDYLRSRDAKVLWYEPANLESFNGYNSRSREVATTRWIRNTYERTGFSGMGKLPEYGANAALYLLITRYSYGTTKIIAEDTDDYIALPRFWVKKATIDSDLIKKKVQKLNKYCSPSEINVMVQTRQSYHVGYLKNKHNTDNAWLEGAIIHLHDNSDYGCFSPYPVHSEAANRRYRWRFLPDTTTPRDFARTFGISMK
ncbi:hypothetical protein TTRE_0000329901 [Trichuris trichiura]|uniref:Uncharacterized protein n=1 Tax=Trichuris trichiura TaxID=36087 RepID=A0A077Z5U8_TRITR|nr:hypothetical protein TTRE_0000329901 [Trichuris trichiura]